MSGTTAGGIKTRNKNLAKDPDFYIKMGRTGGLRKVPKGFAKNHDLAVKAGKKGGSSKKVFTN
jgi:general stress protein YciG